MQLSISTNFADVQRKLNELQADMRNTVLVRTVNKTIDGAKVDMSRSIRQEFNVTATYVRERLRVRKASFKAGRFNVEAELIGGNGKRRSANVIAFAARQVAKGVSVKIKRMGSRKVISGAFIGNKGRTVFRRVEGTTMASRSQYGGTKHGEQIDAVRTIDVPQMFTTRRVNSAVIRAIQTKLPAIFEREARFALSRFSK
jgi:hypothetical protein